MLDDFLRTKRGARSGEALRSDAQGKTGRGAFKIGSHAAVVDAIDEKSGEFYRRYGLIAVKSDARRLYLPMETIRKLDLTVP